MVSAERLSTQLGVDFDTLAQSAAEGRRTNRLWLAQPNPSPEPASASPWRGSGCTLGTQSTSMLAIKPRLKRNFVILSCNNLVPALFSEKAA